MSHGLPPQTRATPTTISAFLASIAGKRLDSATFLADWYMAATGRADPMGELRRGGYTEPDLAKRSRNLINAIGLKRTRTPACGDIGLVSLQKGHLVGAIFTGTHWCMPTDEAGIGALVPGRFRFIAAWSLD